MKLMRSHRLSVCLYALALGAFGMLLWAGLTGTSPEQKAQAQTSSEPEPMELAAYERVRSLREQLSLTSRDLAAMGCDEQAATATLDALKAWDARNHQQLIDARNAARAKSREIRDYERLVRLGRATGDAESTVKRMRSEHASARANVDQVLADAAAAVDAKLTPGQRDVWQTARHNKALGVPSQHTYTPGIDPVARTKLTAIAHARARGKQPTQSPLSFYEANQGQTAWAKVEANMDAVLAAEEATLPLPVELRDEQEMITSE